MVEKPGTRKMLTEHTTDNTPLHMNNHKLIARSHLNIKWVELGSLR